MQNVQPCHASFFNPLDRQPFQHKMRPLSGGYAHSALQIGMILILPGQRYAAAACGNCIAARGNFKAIGFALLPVKGRVAQALITKFVFQEGYPARSCKAKGIGTSASLHAEIHAGHLSALYG